MSLFHALLDSAAAIDVVKRPLPVAVAFAADDGTCETREGPVRFNAGDAILTGIKGERWPVARDVFLASYTPQSGIHPGQNGAYIKSHGFARAVQLRAELDVPVGHNGSILRGSPGDWLIRYDDGSHGVVAHDIFPMTYDCGIQSQ